jgi:hypothetical protein
MRLRRSRLIDFRVSFISSAPELFREGSIADIAVVKIHEVDADTMLDLAFAEIVQIRPPSAEMGQVLGDPLRKQNVAGVTAIHDPLPDVDSRAGHIRLPIHIAHAIDRTAVDAHAQWNFRMRLQRPGEFDGALDRSLRAGEEHQNNSVAAWQSKQFPKRVGTPNLLVILNELVQLTKMARLLIGHQFRIPDDVRAKHVRDLEFGA